MRNLTPIILCDFFGVLCGVGNGKINFPLLSQLKELKPKVKTLALFTSCSPEAIKEFKPILDPIFDQYFFANQIPYAKSQPEAYTFICKQLDFQPKDIIFIDDSRSNISAAQSIGIQGIIYDETTHLNISF